MEVLYRAAVPAWPEIRLSDWPMAGDAMAGLARAGAAACGAEPRYVH